MTQRRPETNSPEAPHSTLVMDREVTCFHCGHAATAEPPVTALWFYRFIGMEPPPVRCPVVWDDNDCGLPPDPCGCRQSVHAA